MLVDTLAVDLADGKVLMTAVMMALQTEKMLVAHLEVQMVE